MKLNPEHLALCHTTRGSLDPETVRTFQQAVYAHHHDNPRPMPWRETGDPYCILVSEIMLQQTQVERVKAKYPAFLAAFPTIADLAAAPLTDLLEVWQGLGYNRRAIALKRCAEEIVTRFGNTFPATVADLESLPGIGPYTARAVAAFAFGVAEPFIETNIRTVFIHLFFPGQDKVSDREIMPLVEATLDHKNPRQWYYALMDYGVMLKQCHPNPGRRSRHHVRQSKFEGSNRQLRSRMLRLIMMQPGMTGRQLAGLLEVEPDAIERNLAALVREGFLTQQGKGYRVPDKTTEG